ncbi:MAG: hypothetical protein LBP26_07670 [Clostridiales bacterium]|jgi:hypothetical protein|nr:hypothetical protein [Clostridiales bacterium]
MNKKLRKFNFARAFALLSLLAAALLLSACAKPDGTTDRPAPPPEPAPERITLAAPVITLAAPNVLSWNDAPEGSDGLRLTVNGEDGAALISGPGANLSSVDAVDGVIKIAAYFNAASADFADSDAVRLSYVKGGGALKLEFPRGIRVENGFLEFEPNGGADRYEITDINNNVYYTDAPRVDLSRRYMVKSVRARCSGQYLDSDKSGRFDVEYFKTGIGTKARPYVISSADEFRFIDYYIALGDRNYYRLGADIAFGEFTLPDYGAAGNYFMSGSFYGYLDGAGFTVSGVRVRDIEGCVSLFASILPGAEIFDVTFSDIELKTYFEHGYEHRDPQPKGASVAVIAQKNFGVIRNVTVQSSVLYAGYDDASAFAVENRGTITGCASIDNVIRGGGGAAGICADNYGEIAYSFNSSALTSDYSAGGIAMVNRGIIRSCYNTGGVTSYGTDGYAGGIAGDNYGAEGLNLVGDLYIANCYNAVAVTGGGAGVGNIAGRGGVIRDSYYYAVKPYAAAPNGVIIVDGAVIEGSEAQIAFTAYAMQSDNFVALLNAPLTEPVWKSGGANRTPTFI